MTVQIKQVMEHYELYCNGRFYCSCQDKREVDEEIEWLEEEFENVEVTK